MSATGKGVRYWPTPLRASLVRDSWNASAVVPLRLFSSDTTKDSAAWARSLSRPNRLGSGILAATAEVRDCRWVTFDELASLEAGRLVYRPVGRLLGVP